MKGVIEGLKKQILSKQFAIVSVLFLVFEVVIITAVKTNSSRLTLQWHWLNIYFLILCGLTPLTTDSKVFFKGGVADDSTKTSSSLLLGSSAFISWIFAKSITNSSKQGARYGVAGGFGYAAWYLSFPAAAIVCYKLRKKGYSSLPQAIHEKFGQTAALVFACCVAYRLYNEVWSNSRVIADFFGRQTRNVSHANGEGTRTIEASDGWWISAVLVTLLPLCYVFLGGMRSSLMSDAAQTVVAVIFLLVVLVAIEIDRKNKNSLEDWASSGPDRAFNMFEYEPIDNVSGLSLKGGMDLFALGAIQGTLSYPFFDPVLTDRCFLAAPKTMARAFTVGGFFAAWFIMLFALIGVHGRMLADCIDDGICSESILNGASLVDVRAGAPAAVARTLGVGIYSVVAIIMITTGISTLDSTFTSVAKLAGPDLHGYIESGKPLRLADATSKHVWIGRAAMVIIAIVGTLPLLDNPAELDATTVAGTIVAGLAGPIWAIAILPDDWIWKGTRPLAFLVPVLLCAVIGLCFRLTTIKDKHGHLKYPRAAREIDFSFLDVGSGIYRRYLGVNILQACLSIVATFVFSLDWCWFANDDETLDYTLAKAKVDQFYPDDDDDPPTLVIAKDQNDLDNGITAEIQYEDIEEAKAPQSS